MMGMSRLCPRVIQKFTIRDTKRYAGPAWSTVFVHQILRCCKKFVHAFRPTWTNFISKWISLLKKWLTGPALSLRSLFGTLGSWSTQLSVPPYEHHHHHKHSSRLRVGKLGKLSWL